MKAMQKVKNFGREEVGISNLIATLVLIVAAIVGGAFVFMTMRDQATTMSSNPDASIQNINVTEAQDSVLATATVKNSGSKPLNSVAVSIVNENGNSVVIGSTSNTIAPGETYSFDNDVLTPANYTAGEQYIIHLSATATDGSQIDKTLKVRVE